MKNISIKELIAPASLRNQTYTSEVKSSKK